ncbi:DUF4397 domain-containing protein [Oscillibacter sp. MSJ-2]|uniref:DUF4397 domain-containing protein n=1 Tax=Dysosmobacter acutus TaxID=2841504 RepID=A0ABS6FAR7_9FIRM|nr:DUF4397 domain-containing protein [Dysosmobacter acutus]MBU5627392.1 DUF4397 domain-containing protein [Dysosmobacter acutus]
MPTEKNLRDVPATPLPENTPVVPLPPIVPDEGDTPVVPLPPIVDQPPAANPDQTPVIPLPPIVDQPPAANPDQTPVIPLPPIVGQPPAANPDQTPVIPLPPIVGIPMPGVRPEYPGYATVRFLNAVADGEPVRVAVGSRTVANNLAFGNLGNYFNVIDGFRTVTIYSVRSPRTVLYQSSVPMSAGEVITLAIVRSGGVLDLVRVSDKPCNNRPANRACIRAVNLVYNSPALDVVLADGRVVFTDVRYKEVTIWRQARPKEYDFYIAQTPYSLNRMYDDIQTVEDLPLAMAGYYLPGYGSVDPLVSFYVNARAGAMDTIYILGNWNISQVIRTKVVEDY